MFKLSLVSLLGALLISANALAQLPPSESPEAAEVYIVSPANGDTVSSPVTVVFGLKGMGVAPAGVERDNTGHHHLLIDQDELPEVGVTMGGEVIHFGGGQTEVTLELEPGSHTLQLVLGDYLHRPHQPIVASEKIEITVSD